MKGVLNAYYRSIMFLAIGCSDIIPPEDAWLKRNKDAILIGCYSSRQTWHLNCQDGKWIGVIGNCSHSDGGKDRIGYYKGIIDNVAVCDLINELFIN